MHKLGKANRKQGNLCLVACAYITESLRKRGKQMEKIRKCSCGGNAKGMYIAEGGKLYFFIRCEKCGYETGKIESVAKINGDVSPSNEDNLITLWNRHNPKYKSKTYQLKYSKS